MKIFNEPITLQSHKRREVFDITTQAKAAMEKSGFRDGVILVSAMHSNSAVIVSEKDTGLLADLDDRLDRPELGQEDRRQTGSSESDAEFRLQKLLPHQVVLAFSESRLDLDPGQAVLFIELDGLRPRRIVVKVMGE